MEQVEASVLGTIYRNAENGYSVVTVRSGRHEVTVVGTLPELTPGEQAVFTGEWIEHPQYGRQLKCTGCALQKPTTLLGIERYLGSGLIRGVGPSTAKMIVRYFGEETLTVLSEHPERLQEVPKMGKKRWMQIAEAYREQQGAREAMVFLQSYGIPATLSVKISKLYGDRTPAVIRENPYRLCEDLEGVGFLTADRIGAALGVAPDSEARIASALKYILKDAAAGQGHVYLPEAELIARGVQLLRRQVHMPLPGGGVLQNVFERRGDAGLAVRRHAQRGADAVGGQEAHAFDILAEAVGILPDDRRGTVAIELADLDRQRRRDAVGLQKDHRFPCALLLPVGLGDLHPALLAHLGHFLQAFRVLGEHRQRLLAEVAHDHLRRAGAHAADQPAAQVALDAQQGGGLL